jgi:hypothetical protein
MLIQLETGDRTPDMSTALPALHARSTSSVGIAQVDVGVCISAQLVELAAMGMARVGCSYSASGKVLRIFDAPPLRAMVLIW